MISHVTSNSDRFNTTDLRERFEARHSQVMDTAPLVLRANCVVNILDRKHDRKVSFDDVLWALMPLGSTLKYHTNLELAACMADKLG